MIRVLHSSPNKNVIQHLRNVNSFPKKEQIQFIRILSTKNLGTTNQTVLNSSSLNNSSEFFLSPGQEHWSKILSKAEKVVGYPTSFLNLRYLVSDELAYFAMLLRKLMQTKHPLIKMARRFILTSDKNEAKRPLQTNGLIVLLIAKAAGQPTQLTKLSSFFSSEISDGIHRSQRCLAEITEMIHMGTVIHRGIVDLKNVDTSEIKEIDQGNKLAVLCGDYLLANACNNLAKLHNTEVVDLMSQVISEIASGIFKKKSDITFLKLWLDNINSNSSSLLANSAKSAMVLVKHSPTLQDVAFNFALNLDISHKIWSELIKNKKGSNRVNEQNTLLNAIYQDKYKNMNLLNDSSSQTNLTEYNKKVIEDCKVLFESHYSLALQNLSFIKTNSQNSDSEAIESLESILNVMKSTID